jgi:hypothetical protein
MSVEGVTGGEVVDLDAKVDTVHGAHQAHEAQEEHLVQPKAPLAPQKEATFSWVYVAPELARLPLGCLP